MPSGRIFVRSCYLKLFPMLWGLFAESRNAVSLSLSGTPGVGKSLFGLLFLRELVAFLKTHAASSSHSTLFGQGLRGRVVYEVVKTAHDRSATFHLIEGDTVFVTHSIPEHWVSDPHTFLIKDGACDFYPAKCSVLWISSPQACSSFSKNVDLQHGQLLWYVPPWDEQELINCMRAGCAHPNLFSALHDRRP